MYPCNKANTLVICSYFKWRLGQKSRSRSVRNLGPTTCRPKTAIQTLAEVYPSENMVNRRENERIGDSIGHEVMKQIPRTDATAILLFSLSRFQLQPHNKHKHKQKAPPTFGHAPAVECRFCVVFRPLLMEKAVEVMLSIVI